MTIYKFAGFWRRFIAYMIDGFIIGIVFFILMIVAGVAYFAGAMSGDSGAMIARLTDPEQVTALSLWLWVFLIFMNIAYFTYFHGSTGRSPGKMLLGLQVVTAQGNPVSFGIAFLRSVGYLISSIAFCLGYIWVGFDKKKQGWHDKIAGTVVIIREPEGNTGGITISDSTATPPVPPKAADLSGIVLSADEPAPQKPFDKESAGVNDQKIP